VASLLSLIIYTSGYNKGWDSGYISGAFDVTLGGVRLEELCDTRGNCKVPEQDSQ
jgi:hypothetical protein